MATGEYDGERERLAKIASDRSAAGREIGALPAIANPRRRNRCRKSLKVFCETYNPRAFNLGWSDDHLKAIARIEEAATLGALYAFAMARGSGKSAICRMAALWAVSYALVRYVFLIGATDTKATATLDAIRMFIRFLPEYGADFPEIAVPARKLQGIAQRAGGQTCGGEPTMIEWAGNQITLPTVPPPEGWQKGRGWKLRDDGKVPSSGAVIAASGLTGEGIRGSLLTLTTGEQIRPDLVLIDDPQTHESARSLTQNESRLSLIMADVLGMAGPGRAIAGVMPCTVIERGDMIDQVLDRSKHPMWRGERSGMMRSMPTDMAAWDRYFEVYSRGAQMEPPDHSEAIAYYRAHQAELDAGAEASWPDRKEKWEVSAVQSAMHLYFRDPATFMAEYQNTPLSRDTASATALTPEQVIAKVSNLPRLIVPRASTRLSAFVDVGAHILWWTVIAWDERFGGDLVQWGTWPEQTRSYFSGADPRPALEDLYPGKSQDAAVYEGLGVATSRALGVFRQEETGAELRAERCLVDANYGPLTDLVYEFCRRSPLAGSLIPSHGKFIGASSNPMASWAKRPGERAGTGWRLSPPGTAGRGRHVVFDANWWKTFAAERIKTPPGAAGCLRIFKGEADQHRMLADHWTSEYPVEVARVGGRAVEEWKLRPGRDNHLWDCLVGCAVAASVSGLSWSAGAAAGQPEVKRARKIISPMDLYNRAQGVT
jgi:hypothetical protein